MKTSSKVTAIIAVFNGETYIGQAIESILAQTYAPIEIVVVDDGSQDDTKRIATRYPVQYFYQPNKGQAAAFNVGIRKAQGSYISFLDADDLFTPEKTASQIDFLKTRTPIDVVFGHVEQFFCPNLSLEERKKWVCPSGLAPGYLAAAGLFRRECFAQYGLFNEKLRIGAFIDWYMRAQENGMTHDLIAERVLMRRIHGTNIGIQFQKQRHEYLQIVKAALQRRTALHYPL